MKRATIKVHPIDRRYASPRVAEITFPDGRGCLLVVTVGGDGTPIVEVYRADPGIEVRTPPLDERGCT